MAKQNKLTPILVIAALAIVGYALWTRYSQPQPANPGRALSSAPEPGIDLNATAPKGGLLSQTRPGIIARPADADSMEETVATVTASNKELRDTAQQQMMKITELEGKLIDSKARDEEAIVRKVAERLAQQPASPSPVGAMIDNGVDGAKRLSNGISSGLGYDGAPSETAKPPTPASLSGAALTKVIAPMGYSNSGTGQGNGTWSKTSLGSKAAAASSPTLPSFAEPAQTSTGGPGKTGSLNEGAIPYFTLPENSTLPESTAMTTLVGRVPIDGRVQDPMQFKLLVGRNNLAASGQQIPDDIAGVVVSGIAVGDMALSCTEGLIQSLTFVFEDGTIRTVSQRSNGATAGFGASGGSGQGGVGGQSLATTPKLGWISDAFGNPCLPGKFVTNAPAYLTDLVVAKAFSIAGTAVAEGETTTTSGTSALGNTSSSSVTGNKGRYVLGRTAGAGSEEVVNWLMKRLNNSFDAVVVRAGTRIAIHLDQEVAIDKAPNGRKLDYAQGRSGLQKQTGESNHGID